MNTSLIIADCALFNLNTTELTSVENATNATLATISRDENLAQAEVGTLATIFIVTVIGNSIVLVGLAMRRIKMTRMYYFLLHLCVSDLITAFFNVLPQLAWDVTYRFKGGNFLCKFIKYAQILGPYLSSYVLVVTAIDRYQAICFPLSNFGWTPRRSKMMISIAWIISLLCCLPQAFIFSYEKLVWAGGVYDCWGTFIQPWGEKAYVTWYAVTVFIIPLIILIFSYVCICHTIWQNLRSKRQNSDELRYTTNSDSVAIHPESSTRPLSFLVGRSFRFRGRGQIEISHTDERIQEPYQRRDSILNPRSHSIRRISRAKVKTVKITVVVVFCYIVCSMPFICVQLWASWCPNAHLSPLWTGPTITILMLLSSLNSCVNPWVYLSFNPNLIQGVWSMCSFYRRCSRPNVLVTRPGPNVALVEQPRPDGSSSNSNQVISRGSQTDDESSGSYPLVVRQWYSQNSTLGCGKKKVPAMMRVSVTSANPSVNCVCTSDTTTVVSSLCASAQDCSADDEFSSEISPDYQ